MKIKKLTESKVITEADETVSAETLAGKETGELPQNSTTSEIAGNVAAGVSEQNPDVKLDKKEVEQHAEEVKQAAMILHPYAQSYKLSGVEAAMQRCLTSVIENREAGIDSDYPNVLIYGLPGFGKTAGVKKFCKDHNLYLFALDASSMTKERFAGTPYPVKMPNGDTVMNELPDMPLWQPLLEHDNVVLVLDEMNRARPDLTTQFLKLINEHDLPWVYTDSRGRQHTQRHLANILFTVAMINPASDIFKDAHELDPALQRRLLNKVEQTPSRSEYLKVMRSIYNPLINNTHLVAEQRMKYANQLAIVEALCGSNIFHFDGPDDVRDHFKLQKGKPGQESEYVTDLNYATLTAALLQCDGTVADFKESCKLINFSYDIKTMFRAILGNYKDKYSKGNNPFIKGTAAQQQTGAQPTATNISPAVAQKVRKSAAELLNDFQSKLGL